MAVVTGGQPNGGYGRFVGDTSSENIAEATKQANGGIFSNFSVPNNGNQITTAGSLDPAEARRSLSGLSAGGTSVPKANTQSPNVQFGTSDDSGNDWRVRISISPNSKILYWDTSSGNVPGLVAPLKATDGFIFPYVPSVTVSHAANYQTQQLTHSNYAQFFYESSSVGSINISGDFTVQNVEEAKYFLAGLYFFRACTKMFYGVTRDYQGSPPPIVYLDGYGQHYLPHVPCVVTSFSHTMPNDVDYLEVNTPQSVTITKGQATNASSYYPMSSSNNGTELITQTINTAFNRVPTASTFSLTLQPVISRSQAIDFDYKEFARGGLIGGKGSAYPGGYL
jgi:hypothetical protein